MPVISFLSALTAGVLLLVPIVYAVVSWFAWHAAYWARRGIPFRPGRLFYGNAKDLYIVRKPRILVYREWTKEHGRTYGIKEGVRSILITSDIEILQEVFVKQFDCFYDHRGPAMGPDPDKDPRINLFLARGARWKRLRSISAPSFTVNSLKKILPLIEDSTHEMLRILDDKHAGKEVFNIHALFMEFTMDTIGRLVLGQKTSRFFQNPRVALAKAIFLGNLDRFMMHLNLAVPLFNRPSYLVMRLFAGPVRGMINEIEQTVMQRVNDKAKGIKKNDREDFIDIMLEASSETVQDNAEFSLNASRIEKALTVDEIMGQVFVFLLAGFDTTSNALGYVSWMLSKYFEVQRKCQAEIDEICSSESVSFEDLSNLRYIEAVCKETLRFYPLATQANSRHCMKTTEVCGMEIEKGTFVQADTLSVHFDESIWGSDVDEFKPERWLDAGPRVPPVAYLAFGAGPRVCIGLRLALLEMKMALIHILRKYDIVKGTEASELVLIGTLTLTPEEVPVRIVRRHVELSSSV